MFNWGLRQDTKAVNAIILGEGDEKGRPFKSRFLQAGLVKYDFGVCLLQKETIDKFIDTFKGCPVVINHKDNITESDKVGVVQNIWFREQDGWFWCDGVLTDDKAVELVEKGYNVSCQYAITDYSNNTENKLHNGNPYDKEILNGLFEHLAIVDNPRYEGAYIAVNAYIAQNAIARNADEDIEWITVKGTHIPIKKGQSKREAIESHWSKTNEENSAKEKHTDSSNRLDEIISSELPEAREELNKLKTEIRGKIKEGEMTQEARRELNKKENKLEQKIENLKKEAEQLRYARDKYIEKYQPKFSTDEEHRQKVKKAYEETDWQQFHKDSLLGKNPNYKTDLQQVIKKAKENPTLQQKVNIGKVSSKLQKVAKENGIDIAGYSHNLDVSGTRHAIKSHSNEKLEEKRGQIAITDEDFERIPDVIYNYDNVSFGEEDSKGTPLVKYEKTFQDGTTIYVEEIRSRQKTLTIKTMYKIKKASNSRTFTDFNPQRQEYTSTIIITDNQTDFNPNATIKAINKYQPVFDWIRNFKGGTMDKETKGLFESLIEALKARNEADDDKKKEDDKEAKNEDVDKRKLIDEVAGIMKSAGADDELIRTAIAKMEKLAYDKSEAGTADNKAKNEDEEDCKKKDAENKCKNEDDAEEKEEKEEKYEELKEEVKKEAENKKAKNSMDALKRVFFEGEAPRGKIYMSQKEGIELGKKLY